MQPCHLGSDPRRVGKPRIPVRILHVFSVHCRNLGATACRGRIHPCRTPLQNRPLRTILPRGHEPMKILDPVNSNCNCSPTRESSITARRPAAGVNKRCRSGAQCCSAGDNNLLAFVNQYQFLSKTIPRSGRRYWLSWNHGSQYRRPATPAPTKLSYHHEETIDPVCHVRVDLPGTMEAIVVFRYVYQLQHGAVPLERPTTLAPPRHE